MRTLMSFINDNTLQSSYIAFVFNVFNLYGYSIVIIHSIEVRISNELSCGYYCEENNQSFETKHLRSNFMHLHILRIFFSQFHQYLNRCESKFILSNSDTNYFSSYTSEDQLEYPS